MKFQKGDIIWFSESPNYHYEITMDVYFAVNGIELTNQLKVVKIPEQNSTFKLNELFNSYGGQSLKLAEKVTDAINDNLLLLE